MKVAVNVCYSRLYKKMSLLRKAYSQSRWQGGRTQGNSVSVISSCNASAMQ